MRRVVLALVLTAAGLVGLVMYKTPSELAASSAVTDEPGTTAGQGGSVQAGGTQKGGGQATGNGGTGGGTGGGNGGNGGNGGGTGNGGTARRVTGPVAQTQYGPVQVRLEVSGTGRITRARAVQYPNSGQSQQISEQALPQLDRAVVNTQGQNVDSVSGATFTSEGYKQSLQAALDRVRG